MAVGYVRVSTEEQRLGPEAQRASLTAWAEREGVRMAVVCEDAGVSGATEMAERPGLLAATAALREHGAGVLVVARRDRLARDAVLAGIIDRVVASSGARVVAADGIGNGDGPAAEFMRTVIDGAAAYERALIRARTVAALSVKRSRGERVGDVPYGWRVADDGRTSKVSGKPAGLEPMPEEQAVIAIVRGLAASGLGSYAIASELGRRGVVTRSGRPFRQSQIDRILASGYATPAGVMPSS